MGRADFRVGGRIFAVLGYPDESRGLVTLTRDQQERLISAEPVAFRSEVASWVRPSWGRRGSTSVILAMVDEATVRLALSMAWRRKAPKRLTRALPVAGP